MVPRGDRIAALLISLVFVTVAAWLYLLYGAGIHMGVMEMGGETMQMMPAWTPNYVVLVFSMWVVMMVAMMLPGAAPTILLVGGRTRKDSEQVSGIPVAILFTAGSLAVWAGFSVVATLVQWGFDRAGILSEAMATRSVVSGGLILLVAGLYQLTPLKHRCLRQCRAPVDWLPRDWRTGARATIAAGVRYGFYGLGCCGVLMGLLLVGGVMNVQWIAGLTLLMLVEQARPWGGTVSHLTGATLVAWGGVALAPAIL